MVDLSLVRDLVTIFGVIAGFSYYVLTVRDNKKNQELALKAQEQALETRQAQLFMQFMNPAMSGEKPQYYAEIMDWEWSDYDEFQRIRSDPKNMKGFSEISIYLESIGSYVRLGFIPIRLVAVTMSMWVTGFWNKFGSMIVERRVRENKPRWLSETEHLYNELTKYHKEHPELAT